MAHRGLLRSRALAETDQGDPRALGEGHVEHRTPFQPISIAARPSEMIMPVPLHPARGLECPMTALSPEDGTWPPPQDRICCRDRSSR